MILRVLLCSVIWGGLIFGSLKINDVAALNQHSICGAWGCGPPTSALLSMHLMWLSLIAPPIIGFAITLPRSAATRLLFLFGTGGILAACAYASWDVYWWGQEASSLQRDHLQQRWWFDIATLISFPTFHFFIASMLGGVALVVKRTIAGARPRS